MAYLECQGCRIRNEGAEPEPAEYELSSEHLEGLPSCLECIRWALEELEPEHEPLTIASLGLMHSVRWLQKLNGMTAETLRARREKVWPVPPAPESTAVQDLGSLTLDTLEARRSMLAKGPGYVPERGETFTMMPGASLPEGPHESGD